MKKILKYSLVLVAASMVGTGCIKETFPTGSTITGQQATESSAGLEAMASAISSYSGNANWASSYPMFYGLPSLMVIRDVFCNDVAAPDTGYDWYSFYANNDAQTGIYGHMQIIWLIQTKVASLCNDIIRMYADAEDMNEETSAYVGAAYAFRSLMWLDMARMYEYIPNSYTGALPELAHLTIPYLHENLTEDEARQNPRVPKEEMAGYIIDGCEKAVEMCGSWKWADKTLPDAAVAYAVMARAYLWIGDYSNAKAAAQNALSAGSFSALTEAQWTDTKTGFNSVSSQDSWMMCVRYSSESSVVKDMDGYCSFTSWMTNESSFGYAGFGPGGAEVMRMCDKQFYDQIPDTDFRKKSWKAPEGSSLNVPHIAANGAYLGYEALPELAAVKFRPGQGEPNDLITAQAIDIPLMRMEEMEFIIAECDARSGNSSTLVNFVKTRNPQYTCNKSGDDLLREVFLQKRIEFWGEGVMFFDYKRCPELLRINRGYAGTNHPTLAQFNTEYGDLAPWFNVCINEYETYENTAIVNNPDPTGTIDVWDGT